MKSGTEIRTAARQAVDALRELELVGSSAGAKAPGTYRVWPAHSECRLGLRAAWSVYKTANNRCETENAHQKTNTATVTVSTSTLPSLLRITKKNPPHCDLSTNVVDESRLRWYVYQHQTHPRALKASPLQHSASSPVLHLREPDSGILASASTSSWVVRAVLMQKRGDHAQ